MPKPAVKPIYQCRSAVLFLPPVKCRHHSNHLIMAQVRFWCELIIPHAGISTSCIDDPMQDILTVLPPVQREIIFMEFFRNRGQHYTVNPLPKHRHHAGSSGRDLNSLPRGKCLLNQGHQFFHGSKRFNLLHSYQSSPIISPMSMDPSPTSMGGLASSYAFLAASNHAKKSSRLGKDSINSCCCSGDIFMNRS